METASRGAARVIEPDDANFRDGGDAPTNDGASASTAAASVGAGSAVGDAPGETIPQADDGHGDVVERAVRGMPFAMVITDPHLPDNPIVYVNKAFERITRYTADAAIGRNCRFLQGEGTDPKAVERLRKGIEAKEDVSVEFLNYRADGEPFVNRLLVAPLFDKDGKVTSMLGIQREVPMTSDGDGGESGAQAAAEGLRRAIEADGADDGASNLASDDPLRVLRERVEDHIAMVLGLVRFDEISPGELPDRAPRSLGRRIEALQLLYEELDRGGVSSLDSDTVSLGAYLSRIAATLTHLEGRRSVRVNVDCDECELPVTAAARLGLLLTELIINALRHAFPERQDGLINVEFKVLTGNRGRLVVKDDGVGLTGDVDWPDASEPGAREAEERHERRTGERVGARLVRQMVEALDAELDVASGSYGTSVQIGLSLDALTE